MRISKIKARTIFNSRGEQSIEISINRYKGSVGSGASKGRNEVRDYPTEGIPIELVNKTLSKGLKGMKVNCFEDLEEVEKVLFDFDDTPSLSKIGGNTVIALEFALLKALSKGKVWKFLNPNAAKMPIPVGNCVGGGKHYKGESIDFQEILLMPKTKNFKDAAFINSNIYNKIGKYIKSKIKTDENAWVATAKEEVVMNLLSKLIEKVTKNLGVEVFLGVDVAASSLFKEGKYVYRNKKLGRSEQIDFINNLVQKFKLVYIEDGLQEEDFDGFGKIKCEMNVGDDLICTNLERLKNAVGKINSVIVKPNQIGSLIKTKELIDYCFKNNITPIISHRSGETNDATISHLAVAWNIPFIKCGIAGKERIAKINELKYIEREIS